MSVRPVSAAVVIGGIQRVSLPAIAPNDRAAVMTAVRVCGQHDALNARIVRIKNTLKLSEIDVSESLWPEAAQMQRLSTSGEPFALPFDKEGRLQPFEETC